MTLYHVYNDLLRAPQYEIKNCNIHQPVYTLVSNLVLDIILILWNNVYLFLFTSVGRKQKNMQTSYLHFLYQNLHK